MNTLTNKHLSKTTIMRFIVIGMILVLDLFLVPWILMFPSFLIKDFARAPEHWIAYGIFRSIKTVFTIPQYRKLYLVAQMAVFALILAIVWDTTRLKKKNRITDGVGGPEPAGAGQHGTSRWQDKREMDMSSNVWFTDSPLKRGGLIYGMEKSRNGKEKVWLNNEDVHTLILGATRTGKSRKMIIPSIWELAKAGESMVIGDPKGELFISTKGYLEKEGYHVVALNLREPQKGNRWNLLDPVNKAIDQDDVPKATEIAWNIAHTIVYQDPAAHKSEPIWKNGEESTIAALILLTALNREFAFQSHMATAYYLLAEYGQPVQLKNGAEYIPLLDYISRLKVKHPAKSAFATANIAPYKTRASFFTTALSDLKLFSDPNISDMTSVQDHELERVGIDKTAIFLIIPDETGTRNVMATLYIDQVYQAMVDLANQRGGRIPRRVNFILDEFGNLPPIPEFDKKITVAGGRGMRFTMAIQDVAQLTKLYGDNAQTIMGNCHIWVYLKTADVNTAKLISEKTGKYTVETENSSSSIQSKGHSMSHGVGLTARPLLLPDEVLRWNIDESLVLPMSHFPARYPLPDLSYWHANEDLGFVRTGDTECDIESNRKIVEQRWNDIKPRELVDTHIWLPDVSGEQDKAPFTLPQAPIPDAIPTTQEPASSGLDVVSGTPNRHEKTIREERATKHKSTEDPFLANFLQELTVKTPGDLSDNNNENADADKDTEDFL